MKELERVAGQKGLTELARSTWKEMVPKILEQARLESHRQSVDLALKTIIDIGELQIHVMQLFYMHALSVVIVYSAQWTD